MTKKARRDFAERLWDQPIIIAEWAKLRAGRHSVSFEGWFNAHWYAIQ